MSIVAVNEKVHIIEKRLFVDDVRRHFVGEVKAYSDNAVRVVGYTWVYNSTEGRYKKRTGRRERIIILGDRIIINVIPKETIIEDVSYVVDKNSRLFITDNRNFQLDISEFVDRK